MRVLIAHGSSTARASLARALPPDDHGSTEIVEVADGSEALEMLLHEEGPGLAVVDWDLPEVEGPELCRLVRDFHLSSPPYIVVLAASTHTDTADACGAGADDCVRTPAPAAALRERLEEGLRVARERRGRDRHATVRATLEAVRSNGDPAADFFGFASRRPEIAVQPIAESPTSTLEESGPVGLEAVLYQS